MKVAVFSTKSYDKKFIDEANQKFHHDIRYFKAHLTSETCQLASGYEAVCVFVNDELNEAVLKELYAHGTRLISLRCAGFNNIDLKAALDFGFTIARVPRYSPHGVAEHAVALMLTLNRQIHRAYNRIREGNFSLDGLLGFEIHEKIVGIVGTGAIGSKLVNIMKGFGAKVICYDLYENPECLAAGATYVSLEELLSQSDIISLHSPLTRSTYHMIDAKAVAAMKKGVMIINTSRGGLIDSCAAIEGLKSGKIGYLGLDVYEEEGDLFFEDLSGKVLQDDVFVRLNTFPNVIITGHQAFFTQRAMTNIAETALQNIKDFSSKSLLQANLVTSDFLQ
jgi:D-lactate dehydrogenase